MKDEALKLTTMPKMIQKEEKEEEVDKLTFKR